MKGIGSLLIVLVLIVALAGCTVVSPSGGPVGEYCVLSITSTAGGSVTTPGEGTFTYDAGTVINLLAEPEEGYQFTSWYGCVGTIANVTAASTTITASASYSIRANI